MEKRLYFLNRLFLDMNKLFRFNDASSDRKIIKKLLEDVVKKGLSSSLSLLTYSEAETLSSVIKDAIGVTLSERSLRDFIKYSLGDQNQSAPSLRSLDILARYLNGIKDRKSLDNNEYMTWFSYKKKYLATVSSPNQKTHAEEKVNKPKQRFSFSYLLILVGLLSILAFYFIPFLFEQPQDFIEEFEDVSTKSLSEKGWFLQDPDSKFWSKRGSNPGFLTLYTIKGDNWILPPGKPYIKNMLTRRVFLGDSYEIEFETRDFFPDQNFQQCGLFLMADSSFSDDLFRMCITVSRSTNNYFAIQTLIFEDGVPYRPKEFSHHIIIEPESNNDRFLERLTRISILSIKIKQEKQRCSIFMSTSKENLGAAYYKIIDNIPLEFKPKYISLYAAGSQIPEYPPDTIPVKIARIQIANQ